MWPPKFSDTKKTVAVDLLSVWMYRWQIDQAVKSFTPERWHAVCANLIEEETRLYVPKFKAESSSHALREELVANGAKDMFDEMECDMSRLGEAGIFWTDNLLHKTSDHPLFYLLCVL